MIAAVRSFDSLLLNQMYQARTQKAVVEFFWTGGQSYEISPDKTLESSDALSERDLLRWESNILRCLQTFEDAQEPLVLWDILAALLEFNKYNPQFVDNLLLKWITSLFSGCPSGASIDKVLFHFQSNLSDISSRRICLLNIICRRLILSKGNGSKNDEKFHIWNKLLINNESELQQRLVAFTLGAVQSHATCLSDVFSSKTWFPQGVAQMICWVLLNAELVHNQLNVLRCELKEVGSRISSFCDYTEETCSFCASRVPFESLDIAWCEGDSISNEKHKLLRCMVSMKLCSIDVPMWFCMCCQRWAAKLLPDNFFTFVMPKFGVEDKELLVMNPLRPLCPFCGILLQRSMPEFLLSSSPV